MTHPKYSRDAWTLLAATVVLCLVSATIVFAYEKCRGCNGSGFSGGSCPGCNGAGKVNNSDGSGKKNCSQCKGDGKRRCSLCNGTGTSSTGVGGNRAGAPMQSSTSSIYRAVDSSIYDLKLRTEIDRIRREGNHERIIAYAADGAWITIYGDNEFRSHEMSKEFIADIEKVRDKRLRIKCVSFTQSGGYIILCENGYYMWRAIPESLQDKLKELDSKKIQLNWITFTPESEWVLFHGNGLNYWQSGIRPNWSKALQKASAAGKVFRAIAFAPDGSFLITYGNDLWEWGPSFEGSQSESQAKIIGEVDSSVGVVDFMTFDKDSRLTLVYRQRR